ncbi:putative membrane protein [Algoriphagus iocasae]|jgi:ion channel-forming bestrophin family protein|uniref:Putative membrane protein n=1 Tax=Algoriphagus iocasae TaxID=1836499 RepID=A0A841MYH5_9BACT|nr:bestrophin family ion channel [Algoriphagus iocasae]MBB6327515.1 putative membrane protein [Algoriphagus iocasae]
MYVKRYYSFWMTVRWSKFSLIYGILYSFIIIVLYEITSIPFSLPWQPISVIGVAVAFFLGFKNNSSYDRTWEARKIWGAIVNESRSFATGILSLPNSDLPFERKKKMIYRHLAWLMALKHVMRQEKTWEHNLPVNKLNFIPGFIREYYDGIYAEIEKYLSEEELTELKTHSNIPSHILKNQSTELSELKEQGFLSDYKQVWLHQMIANLYTHQGMSERIKNFPFPRQYASTGLWITYIFCALIPFGLLDIFEQSRALHYWLTIPFSAIIIWIFFLVDRIGDYSENPFEGGYNDVPISSVARAIEIDLLEMIGDENIPAPYKTENGFLM